MLIHSYKLQHTTFFFWHSYNTRLTNTNWYIPLRGMYTNVNVLMALTGPTGVCYMQYINPNIISFNSVSNLWYTNVSKFCSVFLDWYKNLLVQLFKRPLGPCISVYDDFLDWFSFLQYFLTQKKYIVHTRQTESASSQWLGKIFFSWDPVLLAIY